MRSITLTQVLAVAGITLSTSMENKEGKIELIKCK